MFIGSLGDKLAIQPIECRRLGRLAVRGVGPLRLAARREAVLTHQTCNVFAPPADALGSSFGLHPWTARGATTGVIDLLNLFGQGSILLSMPTWLPLPPGVRAALGDLQRRTQPPDRIRPGQ